MSMDSPQIGPNNPAEAAAGQTTLAEYEADIARYMQNKTFGDKARQAVAKDSSGFVGGKGPAEAHEQARQRASNKNLESKGAKSK